MSKYPKYIGFYCNVNNINWIRVWRLDCAISPVYKEVGGTVDSKEERERFMKLFNIDKFYNLKSSSFSYRAPYSELVKNDFNLVE